VKRCPKCGGQVLTQLGYEGLEEACLQCGYEPPRAAPEEMTGTGGKGIGRHTGSKLAGDKPKAAQG